MKLSLHSQDRETFLWSYLDQSNISKSEAKRANQIKIHKMYRLALNIRDHRYTNENDDHLEN